MAGSRMVVVPIADDDLVLRPPPPATRVVETAAAVRDALRFPLAGPPLSDIASRGARATVVVDVPELPAPSLPGDPRREALAAVLEELARCGVRGERQTVLLAGGLGRRPGYRTLDQLLPRPSARAFRGRVLVHDAEGSDLVRIADAARGPIRASPALVETDLVIVVSAAETIVHGGPAALVAACDAPTVRAAASADSLIQASGSPVWRTELSVEAAIAKTAPLIGVSLTLDHPRLAGPFAGYPHDERADEAVRHSPLRRAISRLPDGARRRILRDLSRRASTTAVHAGTPSVAHAEAMLRGIERRATRVRGQLDTLVVGVPWTGLHQPGPVNPVTAAAASLGVALRLWRDSFPVRDGGTVILVHPLRRAFGPDQSPYRAMFSLLPPDEPDALVEAERRAAEDAQLLAAYSGGRACHPLLPYADWAGCLPALNRVGRVIVAGCRDSAAARALGFVPSHSLASALEMAQGVAGGKARLGVLLGPPYPPLLVDDA